MYSHHLDSSFLDDSIKLIGRAFPCLRHYLKCKDRAEAVKDKIAIVLAVVSGLSVVGLFVLMTL